MKLVGITGTGTGKLGSSVFAVNSGVQIVRQYQPVVSNPSTAAQVAQRAKLKLASQLARDLKKSIAIPKDGLVSSRNGFIAKNFPAITYDDNKAEVNLDGIQLTASSSFMPSIISTTPVGTNLLQIKFAEFNPSSYEKYITSVYRRNSDGSLSFVKEFETSSADFDQDENAYRIADDGLDIVTNAILFVYGVNLTSDDAKAKYNDLSVNAGRSIASLIANRIAVAGDIEVSRTTSAVVTSA